MDGNPGGDTGMIRTWFVLLTVKSCLAVITWRQQPADKLLFEGGMVRLRCNTAVGLGPNDHHHWVRLNPNSGQQTFLSDGPTLSPAFGADVRGRFALQANHNLGQFELIIRQARWYDSGQYGCIVYNRVASRRALTRFAIVDIVRKEIPQGSPECTLVPAHPGPGDLVAFTCTSLVTNALSQLSWTNGPDVITTTAVLNDRMRKVVTFHRRLRDTDNHAEYTCTEKYPLENSPRASCSLVPFDIPMNVTLEPPNVRTLVGRTIIISCLAKAVPPISRYWWLFDGHPVIEKPDVFQLLDGGRRLKIHGVLASAVDQYEVRCKVTNALNMQRSAIGFIKILSSAGKETLTPTGAEGYGNDTATGRNRAQAGSKSKVTLSDSRNLPKVRGTPMSILLATTTGVGATIIVILVVVVVICLRRRAAKQEEIEDDLPMILEISPPTLGQVEEPVPPVRDSSKKKPMHASGRGPSTSKGTSRAPARGSARAQIPPPPAGPHGASGSRGRSRKYHNRHVRHSYQPLRRDRSESMERVQYSIQSKSVSLYENAIPLRLSLPEECTRRPIIKGSRKGPYAPISI